MTARIVPGSASVECSPWVPPSVGSPVSQAAALTAAEAEALRARAEAEGFEAGRQQGFAAGRRDVEEAVTRLDGVLQTLGRPFADLDSAVEQELVMLAFAIARQLVRRELKTDPSQIVGVVREALQALPVAARDVRVHLHPEDATLVRSHLPPVDGERAWSIVEDPLLTRGGARIATSSARVDARLETRLGALVAELLGGERDAERNAAGERPPP